VKRRLCLPRLSPSNASGTYRQTKPSVSLLPCLLLQGKGQIRPPACTPLPVESEKQRAFFKAHPPISPPVLNPSENL
jgi:hypothetical protein